jgi:hypothetical protein
VWRAVYSVHTATDFADYAPAAQDDVIAYNEGIGDAPKEMTLDFNEGWKKSLWNEAILNNIYELISKTRDKQGGWGLPDVSKDYLMGELWGQLSRSRDAWALVQPRFSLETGQMETDDQCRERVKAYSNKRSRTVVARSRRQRVSLNPQVYMDD